MTTLETDRAEETVRVAREHKEVTTMPETVRDVFEELLGRWREEQERVVLASPADKGVKGLRLDLLQVECDKYRKRFEAALEGQEHD